MKPDGCLDKKVIGSIGESLADGLKHPRSVIAKVASLMYGRYKTLELPIALVSMDNCSHNGEKLYNAINLIVEKWAKDRKSVV